MFTDQTTKIRRRASRRNPHNGGTPSPTTARVLESAKTTRKTLAVEAEKTRRLELEKASTTGKPIHAADESRRKRTRNLGVALAAYLERYRAKGHRPNSLQIVVGRTAPLQKHLGTLLAVDLTEEMSEGLYRYAESGRREQPDYQYGTCGAFTHDGPCVAGHEFGRTS